MTILATSSRLAIFWNWFIKTGSTDLRGLFLKEFGYQIGAFEINKLYNLVKLNKKIGGE